MSHIGKHEARRWQRRTLGLEPRRSKFKRKIFGIPVVGWLVGIALPAAAIVGFLVLLGASGTISPASSIDVEFSTASPTGAPVAGDPICSITNPSQTTTAPVVNNATPGAACEFKVRVVNQGPAIARLEGFKLESAGFASGDIRATVAQCGQSIAPDISADVIFTIWVDDIDPAGGFQFDPALDGLEFATDALYTGSECEQT